MAGTEIEVIRNLVQATVTAVSVLGGFMAVLSGYAASEAVSAEVPPAVVAEQVNRGLAIGFEWGTWTAAIAFIIVV
jgi:hypothetical protein